MGPTEKIKLMRANAKEEHMREFLIQHGTNQQAGLAIGIGQMQNIISSTKLGILQGPQGHSHCKVT